jgi:hypothetical protein
MKTLVTIEVEHKNPIHELANMIAGRAYTIQGVTNTEVVDEDLRYQGFKDEEIALGHGEVHRS